MADNPKRPDTPLRRLQGRLMRLWREWTWWDLAIFGVGGLIVSGLFAMALAAAFKIVGAAIAKPDSAGFGTGAVLVALLGAPILIWRTVIAQKSSDLSDEALFNEKISAAITDLHSRRKVTRPSRWTERLPERENSNSETPGTTTPPVQREEILTEWEDDILRRVGAIDRLEALANERAAEAPRIATLLAAYVSELSGIAGQTKKSRRRASIVEIGSNISGALRALGRRRIAPPRTDVQRAAQALQRLRRIPDVDLRALRIDLRDADLSSFALTGADFADAWMQAADLTHAILSDANFSCANLSHADLTGADLTDADLSHADLTGAVLRAARMEGAALTGARMEGANLEGARMEGADLRGAEMDDRTSLTAATLRGAAVRDVNWESIDISAEQVNSIFGDASVTLPGGVTPGHADWPAHWPVWELPLIDPEGDTGFNTQWRNWQADPAGYVPPPPGD